MKRYALFAAMAIFCFTTTCFADESSFEATSLSNIEISLAQICAPLNVNSDEITGITFTRIPDENTGTLICSGVAVEAYDYVPKSELEWLIYVPFTDKETSFSYIPNSKKEVYANCTITLPYDDLESRAMMDSKVVFAMVGARYWTSVLNTGSLQST